MQCIFWIPKESKTHRRGFNKFIFLQKRTSHIFEHDDLDAAKSSHCLCGTHDTQPSAAYAIEIGSCISSFTIICCAVCMCSTRTCPLQSVYVHISTNIVEIKSYTIDILVNAYSLRRIRSINHRFLVSCLHSLTAFLHAGCSYIQPAFVTTGYVV